MRKKARRSGSLTDESFALLGIREIAYVKRGIVDGARVYTLHAADGGYICQLQDRETAYRMLRENGLEPASLH